MFVKLPRVPGESILLQDAFHQGCNSRAHFSRGCGVFICDSCGEHEGLARCFCGWSLSGRDGRQELTEMGENVEDDY